MFDFSLADQSPLEWDLQEHGTSPEQHPPRDTSRGDADPDIVLEPSILSIAPNSEASSQPQITPSETPAEEQNGSIPAPHTVHAASTQGKTVPQMLRIADSRQETSDNDGNDDNDVLTAVDHIQRTESIQRQANNDIGKTEQALRGCFDLNPDPEFERKEALAIGLNLAVGHVDNWYRKQRLALAKSIPSIRVSDSTQGLQIEENGGVIEGILNYCFDKDPDPSFEDKANLAKILHITIGHVDEWHREKRLAFRATSLPNSNLSSQLDSAQTDGTSQRRVNKGMDGNELPNDTNKRNHSSMQSTVSTSNPPRSALFGLPRPRLGLYARSETTQTTAASSSNQSKKQRFKCTFPGCFIYGDSLAGQVRHEREVHWTEEYFPCLFCNILCTADGGFECRFCSGKFRELKAIEEHIISPCDLPKVVKASRKRYVNAKEHQEKQHPSTSESKVDGKNCLKCSFCAREFDRNEDPIHHTCDKKMAWQKKQGLKALFEADGESTIWSEKGLKGWAIRTEGGYPVKWPPKCSFPTCSESFDSLINRAIHFDKTHYVPSPTGLKRGFSDSGIEYAGEDDHRTLTENNQHDSRSQHDSAVERRRYRQHPSHQPVELSDDVRRMDLAGVVDERLPNIPP